MFSRLAFIALATLAVATPAAAQEAGTVADRPALSTKTTQDLIAQREKWGTAPIKGAKAAKAVKATKSEPPPPAKADKAASIPSSYAVLPVGDVGKLIAERETWGKGPAGYETKKVVAPPAASARSSKASVKKTKKPKPAKKKKQNGN